MTTTSRTYSREHEVGGLVACELLGIISAIGYFTLQPNQARLLVLFGAYRGTVRANGFHWANPFYTNGPSRGMVANDKGGFTFGGPRKHPRMKVSLRAQPQRRSPSASKTPRWRCSTSMAMRNTCACRASRRCGTCAASIRMTTASRPKSRRAAAPTR